MQLRGRLTRERGLYRVEDHATRVKLARTHGTRRVPKPGGWTGSVTPTGPIAVTRREFVAEQLSIMVGAPIAPDEALVEEVWAALSRSEERSAPRDEHGNFPATHSKLSRAGLLERPPLLERLADLAPGPAVEPRWPDGRRFAAALTHDVDRIVSRPWRDRLRQVSGVMHDAPPAWRGRWLASAAVFAAGAPTPGDRAPYDWFMREEAQFGFRSTFFVLSDRLLAPSRYDCWYRYHDTVVHEGREMPFAEATRRVRNAGWDVGLHGSYASAYDAAILRHERARLEDIFGSPIVSTRQHFLRFDAESTPRVQATAGLRVDSTVGFSSTIGCRIGLAMPFFWPSAPDLLEVPLTIQDVGLLRAQGRSVDLDAAVSRAARLIERIAEAGGVVTLSWHTHPGQEAPECYRALLEVIARLGGWGCTLAELDDWWRKRRDRVALRRANGAANAFLES